MAIAFLYCILPAGNADEFPAIDAELKRRKVAADFKRFKGGGRCYRISRRDLSKLPKDKDGPYLGDDNSGHSICIVHNIKRLIDDVARDKEWRKIA